MKIDFLDGMAKQKPALIKVIMVHWKFFTKLCISHKIWCDTDIVLNNQIKENLFSNELAYKKKVVVKAKHSSNTFSIKFLSKKNGKRMVQEKSNEKEACRVEKKFLWVQSITILLRQRFFAFEYFMYKYYKGTTNLINNFVNVLARKC